VEEEKVFRFSDALDNDDWEEKTDKKFVVGL
jgi:hypothetical protein